MISGGIAINFVFLTVFSCFQGVQKYSIENKWIKHVQHINLVFSLFFHWLWTSVCLLEIVFKSFTHFMSLVFFYIPWKHHKTSRPNPRRKEKINLNFYFALLCCAWKGFMKVFKAFIKPFEAPQRSVKIKI